MRDSVEQKFLSRTIPEPNTGCLLWTGAEGLDGYGLFSVFGKTLRAHRVAWMLWRGPIPQGPGALGVIVCHRCDTPFCVNPDHLFLGTQRDNIRDCIAKGRSGVTGSTHCLAGHEWNAENTYIRPDGNRGCRPCNARRVREFVARRKARLADGGTVS